MCDGPIQRDSPCSDAAVPMWPLLNPTEEFWRLETSLGYGNTCSHADPQSVLASRLSRELVQVCTELGKEMEARKWIRKWACAFVPLPGVLLRLLQWVCSEAASLGFGSLGARAHCFVPMMDLLLYQNKLQHDTHHPNAVAAPLT